MLALALTSFFLTRLHASPLCPSSSFSDIVCAIGTSVICCLVSQDSARHLLVLLAILGFSRIQPVQQKGKSFAVKMSGIKNAMLDKKTEIVMFSSTAIALYGYDQGMMSLINTNQDYLSTMGIAEESPIVGVIVSVYYLGCAVGAILASWYADRSGRKPSIFACLATTSLGNLLMFVSGLGFNQGAIVVMFLGRIVMGLGVGGIDAVIPVYSSELNSDGGRGKALAQEFQSNIFGLNMAFAINLLVTIQLGKLNQWGKCAAMTFVAVAESS